MVDSSLSFLGCDVPNCERKPREQCGDLGSQTDKQGADIALMGNELYIQSISKKIFESRYNYKSSNTRRRSYNPCNHLFIGTTEASIL
jgi:hypothetical protein